MAKINVELPQTRLLDVAARVAHRKYLPSLEKCRTINDARCVVRKMDKEHVSLAAELKEIWDAYPREGVK